MVAAALSAAQLAQRRAIAPLGGRARARQFTHASQSYASHHLRPEVRLAASRAGARTTLERHGAQVLHERTRRWRLAHPSSLERAVIDHLAALGLREGGDYQREYEPFGPEARFAVDFAFPARRLVVEVHGSIHTLPFFDPERRARRDSWRLRTLAAAGWEVLVIRHDQVRSARPLLVDFLDLGAEEAAGG